MQNRDHESSAAGTTVTLLWLGAKVFWNQESTVYAYFKRLGVTVFGVQDDLYVGNAREIFFPIGREVVDRNREILSAHFGQRRVLQMAKNLVGR